MDSAFLIDALRLMLFGVPCAYVVGCLLLQRKDSHEGPFSTARWVVYFEAEGGIDQIGPHTQKVSLFDWIRRLFGVYQVEGQTWKVRDSWWVELWTCPFCLSFWTALLFSVPGAILLGLPIYFAAVAHFGIATVSVLLHRLIWNED